MLTDIATGYGYFLVTGQLMRLLYGSTWWAHWQDPEIGNPVVTAWKFLAANPGYLPAPPAPQYEAGISDIELWLMMDTAEMCGADWWLSAACVFRQQSERQLHEYWNSPGLGPARFIGS